MQAAGYFYQVTNIFLRLIKMIIAPLVLTTLTSGIGHIESAATVGRIGTKAMIWFLSASFVALLIGLVMVNLLQPGVGAGVAQVAAGSAAEVGVAPPQGLSGFLEHLIPASIIDAMAKNEILQVVVFSLFAGIAISAVGEKAKALLHVIEQAATVILKITTYVMMFAPFAIFAAIAGAISTQGIGILVTYAKLVGDFYISISILIALMIFVAWLVVGRADAAAAESHPLARADRLFHFHVRSRLSAAAGIPGSDGLLVQDRELRAAAGLLLQSGRLDHVLHLRGHVHRPGL